MNHRSRVLRPRRDDGFTLVEVLITVGLFGLVAAVISAAIIVVFRNEDGVVRLTSESHDTQQGVNYFPLDVHAGPLETTAYDTSSIAAGCVNEGTNVLQFDKGDKRVAYRLTVTANSGRLDRHVCDLPLLNNLERVNVADRLDASVPTPADATIIPDGLFVESIQLRLHQDGTDALVSASPRSEPRNSPGDCQTTNPIAASHGYGVFVEGNVELQAGSVTGWVGLGGTLSWLSNITIASGNMSGVSPIYGLYAENVNWTNVRNIGDLDVLSNSATVFVASHGYATGQEILVNGTGNGAIDGNAFTITVTGPNTFTFPVTTGNTSDLAGTVQVHVNDLDVLANLATTTVANHGYTTGQQVVIEGTGIAAIDGIARVATVIDANTFTFPVITGNVSDLTGTSRRVAVRTLEVAREKAAIGGGFVKVGDLVYNATPPTPNHRIDISGPGNPAAQATAGQLNFPVDFNELRDCSAQLAQLLNLCALAGCANEVDITISAPNINACSTSPVPQVLNVPEQYFDGNWQFDTSGPGCQGFSQVRPLILNVIDDGDGIINFGATPVDWTALGDRKNILFNFPNTTVLNINSGFWGQVLAPFAHVTTNGNIDGGVISRQWTHISGIVDSDDDLYDNPITWP